MIKDQNSLLRAKEILFVLQFYFLSLSRGNLELKFISANFPRNLTFRDHLVLNCGKTSSRNEGEHEQGGRGRREGEEEDEEEEGGRGIRKMRKRKRTRERKKKNREKKEKKKEMKWT